MNIQQDIEFLKMLTFNSIDEMNNNSIIQKYFDVNDNETGAIEHIFKGYYDGMKYFNGYHSEAIYPNLYMSDTIVKNKNVVYELHFPELKRSNTFFPITMSCEDIIICILEEYAKQNLDIIVQNSLCSKYNLQLTVALNKDKKIFTAYPIIK